MHTVLVLGGYGNFGAIIARALVQEPAIRLLVAGRSAARAQRCAVELGLPAEQGVRMDAEVTTLASQLKELGVNTLIHTAGPFQGKDYRVAQACIAAGCNYVDLADGRDFVLGITQLDAAARATGVLVTSGASSLPALSAAVVDRFLPEFSRLDAIRHGIVAGARVPGLATLRAVLGYCGKPLQRLEDGRWHTVYGWQGLRRRRYPPPVGWRWLGNCDVPDLTLFTQRYPEVRTVAFQAGLGTPFTHLLLWLVSWSVRAGLARNLPAWARPLHWISRRMQALGPHSSAMHVEMRGIGRNGRAMTRTWQLLAPRQQGPHIPCGAAIALVRKLAQGVTLPRGAMPCVGLLTLEDYLQALAGLELRQVIT